MDALNKLSILAIFLLTGLCAIGQHKNISLRDSLDGAFDLSDYIIDAHGFIPVPYIITEPALGGFGVALIPVFLQKNPPYIDSLKNSVKITPVAPNITGALLGYTVNNTWFTGGFRSGTFVKSRIKYMIGAMYADINMSFYKTFPDLGEKEFKLNIKTVVGILQATKRIGISNWYGGVRYLFAKSDVNNIPDSALSSFIKPIEYSSLVSELGAIVEFDNRDNIFTPDKGVKIHLDASRSDDIFGSDYEFWRLNYYTYLYKYFSKKFTGGLRIDGQQTFGSLPFYLLPYINLRGVPTVRYQGNATILTEAEGKWNFTNRWSLMLYSGAGKAFDEWSKFGDAKLVITYGTGFRYLLARKFKLRAGIDIAKGPENWAYYIVFGSNWLK